MKIIVRKDVAKHQINPLYPCMVIYFESRDTHFQINRVTLPDGTVSNANYMPRLPELCEILDKTLEAGTSKKYRMEIISKLQEVFKKHGCSLEVKIADWFL